MLIKVKTLTGKEIELDIEPNDKVERIKEKVGVIFSLRSRPFVRTPHSKSGPAAPKQTV